MAARLTQQIWLDWLRMAGRTLAGASQTVWQNRDEMAANNALFAKVTGQPLMNEREWRNSITWSAAVLLALSAEQSMKAIAIRTSPNGECLKTHDLERLWNDVQPMDREGIARAAQRLRARTVGTRLGQGPDPTGVGGWTAVVRHHRSTFEGTRYHLETRAGNPPRELTENLNLWMLALAALGYATELENVDRNAK